MAFEHKTQSLAFGFSTQVLNEFEARGRKALKTIELTFAGKREQGRGYEL